MLLSKSFGSDGSEEVVLDLCVRRCQDDRLPQVQGYTQCGFQQQGDTGLDLCRRSHPVGEDNAVSSLDTSYSATMALLQSRICQDKRRSPCLSDESSTATLMSDSPPHHPYNLACTSPPHANHNVTLSSTTRAGKPTRPFKAYPKDPLSLVKTIAEGDSNDAYAEFRRRMLDQLHAATGGNSDNKNMKRPVSPQHQQPSSSMDPKDSAYWERRKKNNEAAKRSRDARRAKEDEIAIRAAFLEQENIKLKYEVATLRNETNRLRCMLFSN